MITSPILKFPKIKTTIKTIAILLTYFFILLLILLPIILTLINVFVLALISFLMHTSQNLALHSRSSFGCCSFVGLCLLSVSCCLRILILVFLSWICCLGLGLSTCFGALLLIFRGILYLNALHSSLLTFLCFLSYSTCIPTLSNKCLELAMLYPFIDIWDQIHQQLPHLLLI